MTERELIVEMLAALKESLVQLSYGDYAGIGDPDTSKIDAAIARAEAWLRR